MFHTAARRITFDSHTTNAPALIIIIYFSCLTALKKNEEQKYDYPKCKRALSTLSRLTRLGNLENSARCLDSTEFANVTHTYSTAANERGVVGIWSFSVSRSSDGQAYTLTKPIKTNFRTRVYGQSLHQLHRNQYHESLKWYSHIWRWQRPQWYLHDSAQYNLKVSNHTWVNSVSQGSRKFVLHITFRTLLRGSDTWVFLSSLISSRRSTGIPQRYNRQHLSTVYVNTLRTGLLNCLNARSRGLTFRHRASCI